MLAIGDLVRIRNLTTGISQWSWARNGMGGDIVAVCRVNGCRRPFYAARIGEHLMISDNRYFEVVLPGKGGAEPVEWDWRDLRLGVFP